MEDSALVSRIQMADMETLKTLLQLAPDTVSKVLALRLQLAKPNAPDASALMATLISQRVVDAPEGFALLQQLADHAPAPTRRSAQLVVAALSKPKTKFVGTDARTLFGLTTPALSDELLAKLHLTFAIGKKRPTLLFVRANGPADAQWINQHAEHPALPADPTSPQRITVRAFDAVSSSGMVLGGKPIPPGTEDPEFDIPASFCCAAAYAHLRVGNTGAAPTECLMDPKGLVPLTVYRSSEEYGMPDEYRDATHVTT
jgi:hypothetical protein